MSRTTKIRNVPSIVQRPPINPRMAHHYALRLVENLVLICYDDRYGQGHRAHQSPQTPTTPDYNKPNYQIKSNLFNLNTLLFLDLRIFMI